jgi:methylmalonyl-CoA/ethylmalonyl-CoA epimerase
MSRRSSLTALGEVMQLAFVPADFDATLKFWIETMGAGPFFALDHVKLEEVKYKGAPANIDFSMVIGYWGEVQIELIRQHNEAASIYKTWREEGREGLHHVCILVDDMKVARNAVVEAKATIAQEARVPGGGEVIYVDTGGGPGTMVEILKTAPGGREFFAMMRDAAKNWDGADPVRKLG